MTAETTLRVLSVFVGPDGDGGNLLGVFPDGTAVPADDRQAVAADLGYSETVFVEDAARGAVSIFTPVVELPFAGHPLVGTAWQLDATVLRPPAGEVPAWREQDLTWIRGRPAWAPDFELRELDAAAAVDAHPIPGGEALLAVWAWEDEAAGRVRARVFPSALGIDEDEATGAAALRFGARLGRPLVIRQGQGSELHVRPFDDGTVAVGGRVALVQERPYRPPGR